MTTRIHLIMALLALAACMSGAEEEAAAGGNTGTKPDPAGGQTPMSAAQVQSDLEKYANAVKARTATVESASRENLYHEVITYNAEEIERMTRARDATGVAPARGMSINTGRFALSLGGEVTDSDYPEEYPTAPETVHFITAERNQLATLDSKMRRSAAWLNKHTCGGFDWTSQFNYMFKTEVLKEYLKQLGEGVIAAAPMALLGAFSPQLAEIVKHLKLIASMDLSATKMDCQAIQGALTSGTQKAMWGDAYSACLNEKKNSGISQATKDCQSALTTSVTKTDGSKTNPQTSEAASTAAGWLTNSYSASQDWLSTTQPPGGTDAAGQVAANAAGTAAGNGGATGNEKAGMQGVSDAAEGGSAANVKNTLGNNMGAAVGDLAHSLFGSVRLQGTGALELGRKSYKLFDLKIQGWSAMLHDNLTEQLLEHWEFLTAGTPDFDLINSSYGNLRIWTWQSRGADFGVQPWLNPFFNGEPPSVAMEDLAELIDNHTMDACAYILKLTRFYKHNDAVLYKVYNEYGIEKFITALAQYECYLYVYKVMKDKAAELNRLAQQKPQSGVDVSAVGDAAIKQFNEAMDDLKKGLLAKQRQVLSHLRHINGFRPWQLETHQSNHPVAPEELPQPEVRFQR
jgi:hypothetical protein